MTKKKRDKLEENIFLSFWSDGLLDILGGAAFLAIGVGWAFHMIALASVAPPLMVPLWKPIRERLVEPRFGYLEFSETRSQKNRKNLLLMNLAGLLALLVAVIIYFSFGNFPFRTYAIHWIPALPVILLAIAASIAALILSIQRFHTYACVLAALGFLTVVAGWEPYTPMLAGGFIVIISGGWRFFRFIKKYPLKKESIRD